MIAYLGLGSNLGERQVHLERAIAALGRHGRVEAVSGIYETLPEGGADQPKYLNAAVRLQTQLSAHALLAACLDIERAQGRARPEGGAKASRTLDIDVLLYDGNVINEPGLCVPHPRLLARPFVRIPLAEVALPGLRHAASGEPLDHCALDPTVVLVAPARR
jgi:2-amino-4-hydroxy-6-hydroxymethyldihydropteridine diphosphokinase